MRRVTLVLAALVVAMMVHVGAPKAAEAGCKYVNVAYPGTFKKYGKLMAYGKVYVRGCRYTSFSIYLQRWSPRAGKFVTPRNENGKPLGHVKWGTRKKTLTGQYRSRYVRCYRGNLMRTVFKNHQTGWRGVGPSIRC